MNEQLVFFRITIKNKDEVQTFIDEHNKSLIIFLEQNMETPEYLFIGPKYQYKYYDFLKKDAYNYGSYRNELCHVIERTVILKYIEKNLKEIKKINDENTIIEFSEIFLNLQKFIEKSKKSDIFLLVSV